MMTQIRKLFLAETSTIKDALKRMDEAGQKIIFVVSGVNRLEATVTDGDIRRAILKGISLSQDVGSVMNRNPICMVEGYDRQHAKRTMLEKEIECLPVVNDKREIVSAIRWLDLFEQPTQAKKNIDIPLVIMAGGEGTRLAPFTTVLPKPLIPVGGKPIIEIIMEKFAAFGCRDFLVSVNYKANILKAYLGEYAPAYSIKYIQENKPLGTVGSLRLASKLISGTFCVTNCDILIEADYYDMLKFHKENNNEITLVVSLKHYTIPYGICEISSGGCLKGIKEKPEYDFMVNTGMYLLEKDVIGDIPEDTFYNMTDLIEAYLRDGKKIGVYPVSDKSWLDMGELQELRKIMKKFEVGE